MARLVTRRVTHILLVLSVLVNAYLLLQSRIELDSHVERYPSIIQYSQEETQFIEDNHSVEKVSGTCSEAITSKYVIQPEVLTSLKSWNFKTTWLCPKLFLDNRPSDRPKLSLDCSGNTAKLVSTQASSSRDIYTVQFGDKCLGSLIDTCCTGNQQVPNVVHYIWYTDTELSFFHFLSFMSALRHIKPCLFLIHGSFLPKGRYWDYFVSIAPNIVYVNRTRPTSIFGHPLAFREHSSDIMRIEALTKYGGIYLDFDEVVLRPIENLRKYKYVQGHELPHTMGSQLVMAKKNAAFLSYWYESYKTDYRKTWAWNALWIPEKLARIYPDLIHVEGFNFTRPNWQHAKQKIFEENYNWSTNYAMHLYARFYNGTANLENIRTMNTTLGSVSRHILFGNKELCVS